MGLLGGEEEAANLLGNQSKSYGTYGSNSLSRGYKRCCSTEYSHRNSLDQAEKKLGVLSLFRYATQRDKWIIGWGTFFAIIHGSGFPLLAIIFGKMSDTFIKQAITAYNNEANYSRFEQTEVSNSSADAITMTQFEHLMNTYTIIYVSVGVVVLISSFFQAVCWEWSCERQAYRLRQEFFYQVLRQEISWFDNYSTGDLALKLSDDLERIREGIGHKFSMIIQYSTTFVMGLVVGLLSSWQLTLVILSLTPVLAATTAFSGKLIATRSAREQKKYGTAGGVAEEVLSSIRTVAAFGGEKREITRYSVTLNSGLKTAIKKYHIFSVAIGLVFFLMYGSYALAFWYACQLLDKGLLSPGNIYTVFFSVLLGSLSLGNAIPFVSTLGLAKGCAKLIFNIIDSKPNIDAYSMDGVVPDKITGRIQFKNVSFRYPSRKALPILSDFSIDIPAGKTVALVGLSGGGKSTVINLLLRFYDPDVGTILIDGNDLKGLNLAWFRNHVGYVAQEPVLFGMSIYENIRYGRDDVTSDEIVQAAKTAYVHDFICGLPDGYNTMVGEMGSQLSGGQKQRIAIARAIVRDPKILLLDEATSALDAKSEAIVQVALERASKGRTNIIVAHRLSTVKDAHLIYAMSNGKVMEYGTHNHLMALEGLYHDLVMAQTTVEDLDRNFTSESADESGVGDDSTKELGFFLAYSRIHNDNKRRKKPRKHLQKRATIVDSDKDRLLNDARELNLEAPGMVKILKLCKPEIRQIVFGAIGCILTGLIMPVFAFVYAQMFVIFSSRHDISDAASFWSLIFFLLACVSFLAFWIRTICVATTGEFLTMRLRLHSFANVLRQSMAWFDRDRNSPSRLSTRLARDAPLVKAAAGHRLAGALTSKVTMLAALIMAFYFGWRLALVISIAFPVLAFSGYMQVQVQKSGLKKDAMLMEDAGRCANEAISNIRTVKSLGLERLFCDRYFECLYPLYIEAHRQGFHYGVAFAFSEAVIFFIYAGAFRYGAYLIESDIMTANNLYRVFFAIAFCSVSIGQTASWIPDYTKAKFAAALIFDLIERKSEIDPFNENGLRPTLKGQVEFKDVHFRYPSRPDVNVLRGLNFYVQPGQTVALVGPSGCGKSTVVSLLERFYDVVSGHVMVDGYDVRSINIQHLRAHIGVVTQEPVIFDCTIRENIAYGYGDLSDVPEDLILEAARCANIHNFIMSLPDGYDTPVGGKGTQLSVGQKQRIAIARAIIRDPKILLLDEATSALDTENEKLVQEALEKARAGRTCIIIAHRLSTVQNADFIAVISRGKVVELGTHEHLKNTRGVYYRLTRNQQVFYNI